MTNETLQQKIDANFRRLCEFHFDGYQAELDTWAETNEALQEFREAIEAMPENHDNSWLWKKKILALIGEKNEL